MLTEGITVICGIFFVLLFSHWLMVRKMGRWKGLPGPYTPLVFVLKSLFTCNNVIIWRETYKKYQKVNDPKYLKRNKFSGFCLPGRTLLHTSDECSSALCWRFQDFEILKQPSRSIQCLSSWFQYYHFEQMSRAGLVRRRGNSSSFY